MLRCVLILGLMAIGLVGCRESDGEPRYNRNLGSAGSPLLPGPGVIMDTSLRANGSGQAIDLPALPEEIPSVDQVDSEPATADDEIGEQGDGMDDDTNPDDDPDEIVPDDEDQESEPDEPGTGD